MDLLDGCEWPEDPRLQICSGCCSTLATQLLAAMQEIAKQNLADEMDDHTSEHADWEGGYEAIVLVARRALDSENETSPSVDAKEK